MSSRPYAPPRPRQHNAHCVARALARMRAKKEAAPRGGQSREETPKGRASPRGLVAGRLGGQAAARPIGQNGMSSSIACRVDMGAGAASRVDVEP